MTGIADSAFSCCENLTSVTIPDSVTRIGDWAFYGCTSLVSVIIPNSVMSIGEGSFQKCTNLKDVNIPLSVVSIGANPFDGTPVIENAAEGVVVKCGLVIGVKGECPEEVVLREGVRGIAEEVFKDCTILKSITLSKELETIGSSAFDGCTKLTEVVFEGAPPTCGNNTFSSGPIGYYLAKYATEWKAVLDEEGKWNGIEMKQIEDVVFPEVTTKEELAAAFEGVKDSRLAANITNVTEYATFKTWMDDVAKGDVEVRQI